jgi:hypothetical protein
VKQLASDNEEANAWGSVHGMPGTGAACFNGRCAMPAGLIMRIAKAKKNPAALRHGIYFDGPD